MLGGLGGIISSALGSVGLGGAASGAGAAAGLGLGPIAAALGMEALNLGMNERSNSMQRKHEWAMWNAQNEYNKPINQMARLREAGLNPNLVYGSGATTLAAPFHSSTNQAGLINPLAQLSAMQQLKQVDAMTQQIEAQKDHIKAQSGQISTQNSLIRAQKDESEARRLEAITRTAINSQIGNEEAIGRQLDNRNKAMQNVVMSEAMHQLLEEIRHKQGASYRWSRNVGEWVTAISPFFSSGANAVASHLSWHRAE